MDLKNLLKLIKIIINKDVSMQKNSGLLYFY